MNYSERIELLKNTPVFWSRLGIGYDPPTRDENGRWLLFSRNFEKYRYLHQSFYDIGVKIHSAVIPNGWFGVDDFDYTDVDEILDSVMDIGDDFYFLPRVKLTPPIDWCEKNPEEVFVYSDGPRDAEGIEELVGTLKQDILGYDSAVGYSANGLGFTDPRPNVGGVIGMQSFASEKWLKDAGDALKRLIKHIETKPYASRIIGYHIAYGNCGETAMSGSWNEPYAQHGDYGISAAKRYKKYCEEKSLTNNEIPEVEILYKEKKNVADFFRSENSECVDYSMFNSEVNVSACEYFCKIVKEASPDYVAGIFYGYILGQPNCSNSGHLGIERVLESDYIDFLASPKGYYKCGPFGPGLEQAPCNSFIRKKLYIDEIDNRTYLNGEVWDTERATNLEETKTVLLREFSKNLAFDQGYWWMDLGEGVFDSPDIMDFIKKLNDISVEIKKKPTENITEVLLVIDEESMHYHTPSFAYHSSFIKDFASNIKMCGAPVTLIRKSDLFEMDLKQFKTVFFLNCFKVDNKFLDTVYNRFSKGTVFVWNYAAGCVRENFGFENTRLLTTFTIDNYTGEPCEIPNSKKNDFPPIYIADETNVKVMARYSDGKAMIGEKLDEYGHRNIMCCMPMLTIDELYDIIKSSGAFVPGVKHCTVYANNKFITFCANEDVQFKFCAGGEVTDAFDEKISGTSFDLDLKRGQSRCFVYNK